MGHSTDLSRFRMNKRILQMKYLLDNFDKPIIDMDGLNEMRVETNGFCPTGITMAIINFNSPLKEFTYTSISNFMSHIQSYLPKELRITTNPSKKRERGRESPLWNSRNINSTKPDDIGEETKEYLNLMIDWLSSMKAKCLNELTFNYLTQGKTQFIEVMKRRYKDTYSEKVEQEVQAKVDTNNQINIIIEDV